MNSSAAIQRRRHEILAELAGLEYIRRGSVTEQVYKDHAPGGELRQRGPYPLYTFKRSGQTVSRRINTDLAATYREQIANGRRFQELTHELMELGERLCDGCAQPQEAEKKGRKICRARINLGKGEVKMT